eukprot:TRINITY_DN12849_c0_g1_i1.p1 TRINITY_DN12849_c0_g1~~TRINITY_DN12849_c0_g1_i1.p1  ORF type:complete len:125 (+),score=12.85 TRINITY_DN12849_c0_g1_i1:508-882(+)
MLYMWKQQQFGLGWLRELNVLRFNERQLSNAQFVMLNIYLLIACAAIIECSIVWQLRCYMAVPLPLVTIFGIIGVMWLATVLHNTPKRQPFGSLLWYMRAYFLCIGAVLVTQIHAHVVFEKRCD